VRHLHLVDKTILIPRGIRLTKRQRAVWDEFAPQLQARNRTTIDDAGALARYCMARVQQERYARWYPKAYKEIRKQIGDIERMYREQMNRVAALLELPKATPPKIIKAKAEKK